MSSAEITSSSSLFERSFAREPEPELTQEPAPVDENHADISDDLVKDLDKDDYSNEPQIVFRALVTTKEAGVIIGKGGNNVTRIRKETGARAGITKQIQGVPDRVLSMTGSLESVARALALSLQTLVNNPPVSSPKGLLQAPPRGAATLRLLISHSQMGTIIGKQGFKIKSIQEECNVRMMATKDFLPNSTERIVEIQGTPENVYKAIYEVGKSLLEDYNGSNANTIFYTPQAREPRGPGMGSSFFGNGSRGFFGNGYPSSGVRTRPAGLGVQSGSGEPETVREIPFPGDMVGCLIGKGGSNIHEIRQRSGARISIPKEDMSETGERLFTISGSNSAVQKALELLYEQIEREKERRSQMIQEPMEE